MWQAYQRINPWGEERADLRMGILATVIAAPNVKQGHRLKPSDFMPDFTGGTKRQNASQIQATMNEFAAAHNAMIEKRQGAKPSPRP